MWCTSILWEENLNQLEAIIQTYDFISHSLLSLSVLPSHIIVFLSTTVKLFYWKS